MKRITRNLLERSQEAFTLAIELFNKPTIRYRIEAFCFFYVNAWELLLKARIVHVSGKNNSIFYPKKKNQTRKSLSLRDALLRSIPNENDPVRKNVEEIADLRDQGTHLLIPDLESVYGGVFQAGVLNYVKYLKSWFGIDLVDRRTPPFLTLVTDIREPPAIIRKRYGKEALEFLQAQDTRIAAVTSELADTRFAIPIEYKLALTKKPGSADITLSTGPGAPETARVVEVAKDIAKTHPHTQKTAVKAIKERLPEGTRFTSYDFQAVAHREKLKKSNNHLHYRLAQANNAHFYSTALVDLVVEKVEKDPEYLKRSRERYGNYQKQKRTK